ncbi:glycosyltransferase family 2 protein [Luteibacter sp. 9133]|uniref:glycosyltransferase family 2 protein n=1 Tax=Luteibacter sp. 9133 TaxID=1500891 RepID=UPI0005B7B7CC|nr:glycosyltransferase family 2 protein [Luteibacter sp. 9133]
MPDVAPDRANTVPRVQVFIPTYNRLGRLGDAISSVLSQTCAGIEIVVLDNASSDGTAEALGRWAEKYPQIRHVRHVSNIGMIANFNAIAGLVDADFFTVLTDDDTYEPDFIATALGLFDAWPSIDMVACDAPTRVHGVVKGSQLDYWREGFYPAGSALMKCFLGHYPLITNCLYRAALREDFYFHPALGNTGDGYILTSILASHDAYVSRFRSGYWNNDGDNASSLQAFDPVLIANTAIYEYGLYRALVQAGRLAKLWLLIAWCKRWTTLLVAADKAGFDQLRVQTKVDQSFGPFSRLLLKLLWRLRVIRIVPGILSALRRRQRARHRQKDGPRAR